MPYLRVNSISFDNPSVIVEFTRRPKKLTVRGVAVASIHIPPGAHIEMCGNIIGVRGKIINGNVAMVKGDSLDISWQEGLNDDVFEVMTAEELLNDIDLQFHRELVEMMEAESFHNYDCGVCGGNQGQESTNGRIH